MFSKFMDMTQEFTPGLKKEAAEYIDDIYTRFRKHVEDTRGPKLKISGEQREKTIYSSDVFLAEKALELG